MRAPFSQAETGHPVDVFDIIDRQKRLIFLLDEEIGKLRGASETDLSVGPSPVFEQNIKSHLLPVAKITSGVSTRIGDKAQVMHLALALLSQGPGLRSKAFDETDYMERFPDVAQAVTTGVYQSGFEHWLLFGLAENRTGKFLNTEVDINALSEQIRRQYTMSRKAGFRGLLGKVKRRLKRMLKVA
jgi:hypothetical protein